MKGGPFGMFGGKDPRLDLEFKRSKRLNLRLELCGAFVGQPCFVVDEEILPKCLIIKLDDLDLDNQADNCVYLRLDNKDAAFYDTSESKLSDGCFVFMLEPLSDSEKENLGKGPYTHKVLTAWVYENGCDGL